MARLDAGVVDVFVLHGAGESLRALALRRAHGTRCTGAWETVHGRVEPGERPEDAALREVWEETGLSVDRLYNVIAQPFYLHRTATVQVAVVFAAFVQSVGGLSLSAEHDGAEWLRPDEAIERLSWPRSVTGLRDVLHLLRSGHAGPVEDVLRVR
jgi:8-oxo-dGTP pyrophosphatase MutT (NUDIX family)